MPAVTDSVVEFRLNNLTIIDYPGLTGSKVVPPVLATGAGFVLDAAIADGAATDAANATLRVEIMGNLNLTNNGTANTDNVGVGATATTSTNSIRELIVHGDVSIVDNNTVASAPGTDITVLSAINGLNLTVYGQVNLGGTKQIAAKFLTDPTTVLNIAGESKRFEFPEKANENYRIGKLILNRPAGARFNNTMNVVGATTNLGGTAFTHVFGNIDTGAVEEIVIDLQRGDLNLNGNNITFANPRAILQETAGNTVTNTGTSYFSTLVHMPAADATGDAFATVAAGGTQPNFTRGAILSYYVELDDAGDLTGPAPVLPTENQFKSIGITGAAVVLAGLTPLEITDATIAASFSADATEWQSVVRRYPKGVFVPDVGISAQRYYYIKPTAGEETPRLTAYYDKGEVVGTENTMKFYVETVDNVAPTSDAFSNAEQLLGSTMIFPSTDVTLGRIDAQKFEDGKSYNAAGGLLAAAPNGYLLAIAALPGGGGYKE